MPTYATGDTRRDLNWSRYVRENPWLVPVLGAIGVVVTFVSAGPLWGLLGLYVLMVLAIVAMANSLRLRDHASVATTGDSGHDVASSAGTEPKTEAKVIGGQEAGVSALESTPQHPTGESPSDVESTGPGPTKSPLQSDPVVEAMLAAHDSDPAKVRSALEPWIKASATQDEEKDREAQLYFWLSRAGDSNALEDLRKLADANPDRPEPALYLASTIRDFGEPVEAARELTRRAAKLSGNESASVRLAEARMWRQAGGADEAERLARDVSGQDGLSPANRAEAFAELGFALDELDRKSESFGALERSLEIDPTQSSVRFNLAYEYAANNLRELAIVHYEAMLGHGEDGGSKNNLSILYADFGLNRRSVTMLKESFASGLSLPAGNLAMTLVNAGFEDEAHAWIEKGRSVRDIHGRVEEAAARLAAKPEEETTALKPIQARGRDLRQVFRLFAVPQTNLPEGSWQLSTGPTVTLAVKANSSSGSVGDAQSKVQVEFTLDQGRIGFKYSVGQFGLQSWYGEAAWDAERMLAYLRDSPSRPSTALMTLTRVG